MVTAQRGEPAFAGPAALVPGHGVVQVAAGGGPGAARRGAPVVACADQVGELAAGMVSDLAVGVVARTAGDGGQRCGDGDRRSGAGRTGAGWGVAAPQAGVGGGGAVGIEGGDAPAGAGMSGCGGRQVEGIVAVERAAGV